MVLIHTSYKKITKLRTIQQTNEFKPIGLWYAPNKIWLEFVKDNIDPYKKRTKYMYIIKPIYTTITDPDPEKVLQIKNLETFDKFTIKYGKQNKTGYMNKILIDWQKVEQDYGGVEVIPFLKTRAEFRYPNGKKLFNNFKLNKNSIVLTWLTSWDIPSGCIWNANSVKEFNEV